jgi:DNA repair exonuclease SbcCD ATPase subunit
MVVSGRNGSGKSSFVEALELALTGTSYRWHEKETPGTSGSTARNRVAPVGQAV